jgi:hypothetical protein
LEVRAKAVTWPEATLSGLYPPRMQAIKSEVTEFLEKDWNINGNIVLADKPYLNF